MLSMLALVAATSVEPVVSTDWLQKHLDDPHVRVIATGDRDEYTHAHIPGARFVEHMDTVGSDHRLLPPDKLATTLAAAGAEDGTHIVLYGDSPMTTGWLFMTLAAIGHAADVSLLDGGIRLWQAEKRPTSTSLPPPASGPLTVRPAGDVIVDADWVRSHLDSTAVRILDVRTTDEWNHGHLPSATLVSWQDLFADQSTLKFKSLDGIRGVFTQANVKPDQQIVTYCAVGMRASLMYWAARAAGLDARVYVGSWNDWRRSSTNPVAR
jgi:thiosulfate/3-mercaptopyruvate sulfurtransferase